MFLTEDQSIEDNCCSSKLNLDNIADTVALSKLPMGNLLSENELQVKYSLICVYITDIFL